MIESLLAMLIVMTPAIEELASTSNAASTAIDPGPHPSCPSDMRLVTGIHDDEMERLCLQEKANRCWSYVPDAVATSGKRTNMRFCMDQFEAPNKLGAQPLVMMDYYQSQAWCAKRGKRLCTEQEFETACEGPQLKPYFYGWKVNTKVCNSDKAWKPFDERKLGSGGKIAEQEVKRLWQATPAGAKTECCTRDGIYDLLGNVEEWVTSRVSRKWPGALMGGFWAKPWTGCRGTNDSHEPKFVFYQVGFRCCQDAATEKN